MIAALKDKTIDLTLPTVSFVQDATLTQVLSAAGLTLVNETTAKQNFFESFTKDYAGTWLLEDKQDNSKVVLYIDDQTPANGNQYVFNFTLGEAATADANDSGEPGQFHWDQITSKLTPINPFSIDTNGNRDYLIHSEISHLAMARLAIL